MDNCTIEKNLISSISGHSSDSDNTNNTVPTNLAPEEINLALNKEATETELVEAINKCRELIVENSECSSERKWLVRHLIELRLRLQEYKEAMNDSNHPKNSNNISVNNRTIKGHHLKLQSLLKYASNRYCDHCTGIIWSVVQAWYVCEDCGYTCHYKCINSIIRECAHVISCENGQYEFRICPEIGMSAQDYLCAECKTPLIINLEWSDVRRCDYNGLYYCSGCHWGSSAVIPARVVHNWDLEPRFVCQANLQLLRITAEKPLINLEKLNPALFTRTQELKLVKRLRKQLQGIRKYLSVCRKAQELHLLWKCEKPHLLENVDYYSLQDLVDTQLGELPSKLHDLVDLFLKHIKHDCEICSGRGHICEICKNKEILFPFSLTALICDECKSVFHKICYNRRKMGCPKCLRLKKRLMEH